MKPKYTVNDTIGSLATGVVMMLWDVFTQISVIRLSEPLYTLVYDRFRVVEYDAKEYPYLTFFALMFSVDFGYYCLHRCNHEWHFFWSGHRVHHSGEVYNLATALRQSVLQTVTSPFWYLPLALVFSPSAFRAHKGLNTLYQFWVHTELVGWLGPLEYILSTPSSHRMHHRPPGDCNYGGVFIIWDRMFGSYMCENITGSKDYYGLSGPTATFDTVELNVQHVRRMKLIPGTWWKRITTKRRNTDWTCRPWRLVEPLPPPPKEQHGEVRVKYQGARLGLGAQVLSFTILLAGVVRLVHLLAVNSLSDLNKGLGVLFVVSSLSLLGRFLDTGSWLLASAATAAAGVGIACGAL
jgi:sterol desaturase/sphingolipid hydroxylase (fatty acid hydroxylase superfamily)